MRKKILLVIMLLSCLGFSHLFAQTKVNVSGFVTDRETNDGVPGVSVLTGTPPKALASTDSKGHFQVLVDEGATLLFRSVGYTSQQIKLRAGQKSINIRLAEDNSELNEVVIRGYQKRTRETTTGSSFIVSGSEVQDVPVSNVEQLLQGKVPGLNIQVNTGAPGFRGTTQIRGLSSLSVSGSGNETFLQPTSPLYIIDGVPMDADKASEYGFQQQGPGISPLSLIPQEDIASIEILKDAQATSLYGSRGAYGVILITTKRGNSKIPRIRYTANFYVNKPPKLRETLGGNAERNLKINQIINNSPVGGRDPYEQISILPFLADSLNGYYNNSTDWQGVFYQSTYNQTHNLAIDGGDQKFNYKSNLGYYSEKGVIKNTGFDRYNLNLNMEFKPIEKLRFFGAIFGSIGKQQKGDGSGLLQTGVASNGQSSTLLPGPSFFQTTSGVVSSLKTFNDNSSRNLRTNIEASYQFIPGLALTSSLSYDYSSNLEDTFTPAAANDQFSRVYGFDGRSYTLYNRNNISYSKSFNAEHNIFLSVFNESYKQGAQTQIIQQEKTPNDQFQGPLGFDAYSSKGGGILNNYKNATLASFAAAFTYDYMKKYVLDLSYRLDGSSGTGADDPYKKNPAIGLRWNFGKENWMSGLKWLSYGDLRATWGQSITPSTNLANIYGVYNIYSPYNNSPAIGINFGTLPNPKIKPSTKKEYNFGFDAGLFGSRLELTFDTYYNKVDNLVFTQNLSNEVGFDILQSNEAAIANYGYELSITARPLSNKSPFNWTISVNGAINKDILTKLPAEYNGQHIYFDANTTTSQHVVNRVGRNSLSNFTLINQGVYARDEDVPVDPVTGLKYSVNGAFLQAGDPIWKDANGDYKVTSADYEVTGNSQPTATGGISTNLIYKNWGFNVYASYTWKRTILNNALADRLALMGDPLGTNGLKAVVPLNDFNMWTKPGDVAKYPYAYDYSRYGQVAPFRMDQDLWAEDGSYLKINTITVSYMFNKKQVQRWGINSLRVYLSANNVASFSGYKGPNPENVTALGRDASGGYPVPRSYNIGLNLEL